MGSREGREGQRELGEEERGQGGPAYGRGGVVGALGHDGVLEAVLTAGVGSRVAVADGGPGPVDSGAAAGEEEVVLLSVVGKRGEGSDEREKERERWRR
jgi:hypothetical protein